MRQIGLTWHSSVAGSPRSKTMPAANLAAATPASAEPATHAPDGPVASLSHRMVEVAVTDPDDPHWMRDVRDGWGARLELRGCRVYGPGDRYLSQLVEVQAPERQLAEIVQHLGAREELLRVDTVPAGSLRLLVRTVQRTPFWCRALQPTGAICTGCRYLAEPDGRRWTVVCQRGEELRSVIDAIRDSASRTTGTLHWSVRRYTPSPSLTPRESAAIAAARDLGYYHYPRHGRLGDVARSIGVSRSTAAELLRRAEAKLLSPDPRR